MGIFGRKKVSKTAPEPAGPVPGNTFPNRAPPLSSMYATSTTQTPQYWSQQPQYQQQPPPPYHKQQQQQYPVQWHPSQRPQGWSQSNRNPSNNDLRGQQHSQPIVVNQHYYITPPSPSSTGALPAPSSVAGATNTGPSSTGTTACPLGLDKFAGSVVNIAKDAVSPQFFTDGNFHPHATQLIDSTASYIDHISSCFNDVMTMIDRERLSGHEKVLFTYQHPAGGGGSSPPSGPVESQVKKGVVGGGKNSGRKNSKDASASSRGDNAYAAVSIVSGNYFAKVELYANSKLPLDLPQLRLYMPTWPLLCMAAQYAECVYEKPKGAERDTHVGAKNGTKAMVIKSVPMDHMNTIVFAIRGSATFTDWAVNFNIAHASPSGFLDDPGNFCHAGFLTVARNMVKPVAARLRQLLEEDPGRSSYSLLITGHSAGGAVATLLYSHMLATSKQAQSELNSLTGCFKRVHCVTFGTPPVSLLPLTKPERPELRKSLFLTFVNEGDPVARADAVYVKSLLELLASPAPTIPSKSHTSSSSPPASSALVVPNKNEKKSGGSSRLVAKASKISLGGKDGNMSLVQVPKESPEKKPIKPVWQLPPSTLSSPGRIVVLRSGDPKARLKDRKTVEERLNEGVIAQTVSDEQLRGVVWGDPVCHVMKLYSGRIEVLAVGAVTGKHG